MSRQYRPADLEKAETPVSITVSDHNDYSGECSPELVWSHTQRQNLAFAKVVVSFKDQLDHIRTNKSMPIAPVNEQEVPATPSTPATLPAIIETEGPLDRKIRIYRTVHHALSSIVSIIIAVLQSMTYAKYQETKNVPGAWPQKPTLLPTVLLLGVAVMALAFDIACLIAYLMPGRRIAKKAFRLAMNLHYFITGAKGLSFTIAASVCRTGFSVAENKDLWGWSCSQAGEKMQSVNNASFNCTGNVSETCPTIFPNHLRCIMAITTSGMQGIS